MTQVERYGNTPSRGLMAYGAQLGTEFAPLDPWDDWVRVFPQVVQFAEYVQNTDFVPDVFKGKPDVITAVVLAGRELHLGPMASLQHLYPVKGRVGQTAQMMRAQAQAHGHDIIPVEMSNVRCIVKGRRKGTSEWVQVSFTSDQATKMGLSLTGDSAKGPGKYTPEDKLFARASARLCRRLFADCISSLPSVEELEEEDATTTDGNGHVVASGGRTKRMQRRTTLTTGKPPATAASGTETAGEAASAPDGPTSPDDGAEGSTAAEADDETSTTNGNVVEVPENEVSAGAEEPRVREQQLKALGSLFTKMLQIKDARDDRPFEDRHLLTSAIIGRLVDSWSDLTADEAGKVISATGGCPREETERREWIARGIANGAQMVRAAELAAEQERAEEEAASVESAPVTEEDEVAEADVVGETRAEDGASD